MRLIPEKIDSKFRFVLVAAKRAEQLLLGARPRVEGVRGKLTRVAQEEVFQDAIQWEYGPAPEPVVEAVEGVEELESAPEADAGAEGEAEAGTEEVH